MFGAFTKSIPWKHFSRKNLGYLFAIQHGAEFIFDFDDDNYILVDDDDQTMDILQLGNKAKNGSVNNMTLSNVKVIMQGPTAFNHHPIMGSSQNISWARGFPIDLIQNKYTQGAIAYEQDLAFVDHATNKKIGVIQYLADGNPDIDAIHRLTKPLPLTFSSSSTSSILVPYHSYAPYNAQATIHTRASFWATLLPTSVPGRVSDIWRSYFAQCIFKDIGLQLVFSSPIIEQKRNEHDYMKDYNAESDLYVKSGVLIDFLSSWTSDHTTLPERMEQLWIDLYEHGYIDIEDVHSVKLWLGALKEIGYKFPPLSNLRYNNIAVMGQFNYADRHEIIDDVVFWTQKTKEYFSNVIVAGPFSEEQMLMLEKRSIIAMNSTPDEVFLPSPPSVFAKGFFAPMENLMNALQKFKDSTHVEGVLYVHDDGILNITELSRGQNQFPSHEIIASTMSNYWWNDIRNVSGEVTKSLSASNYWIDSNGILRSLDKEHSYKNLADMKEKAKVYDSWMHFDTWYCTRGRQELAKDPKSDKYRDEDGLILFPAARQADFLYVPIAYADEFIEAIELHLKHTIFLECAMSTVVDMVVHRTNATVRSVLLCTDFSSGAIRRTSNVAEKCKKLTSSLGFIHPMKISNGYKNYSQMYDEIQS